MKERSDVELVIAAQNDDEQALSEIFQRYQKSLYFIAYKITNNKDDAQDAIQETFLQVTKSIKSLKRPDYLKLWLNRIVAGKCRDIFRHNKTVTIDMDNNQFQYQYLEERKEFLPEYQMRFHSDQEVVDYYIAQLPYVQREAIVLAYFQNMSMQEIAQSLDESVGTIKSRIHLAKKTLAKRISAYESREGIKLNFRADALEAVIATALAKEYHSSLMHESIQKPMSLYTAINSVMTRFGIKLAVGLALGIGIGGGTLAYYGNQPQKQEPINDSQAFEGILFRNQRIQSDQAAYFLLMNWAMNEEQMKLKTQEEIAEYRPVYEYLKKHNSAYYQSLNANGYVKIFEVYF